MASISSKLAPKHKQALASFWQKDKEAFMALSKLIKDNAGRQALSSPSHEHTRWLQGQDVAMDLLVKEFEKIDDWSQKH
jgi:hypothetical protein